jgi:hypothetical protein
MAFCIVRNFLEGHFKSIVKLGIGLRHVREGSLRSLVVEVILVSNWSINNQFNINQFHTNSIPFFETTVRIFPSSDWTVCSMVQSEAECLDFQNAQYQNNILCGWCSLLLTCMQGIRSHFLIICK